MNGDMVQIENLQKKYGDFSLNITLSIPSGTVTGLVGKNGAGKSTTIKAILGLIKREGGSLQVMGKEAGTLSAEDKENIGVCLADSVFSGYLNISDIVKIMKKMYKNFDENMFLSECRKQRLPEDKQIKDFSTGMKAKVRVLCALCHNAKFLIMDEPTAGLDIEARNDILDILRRYVSKDEERSILISSHIATDLEGICDDIYLIDEGKVILHEDTDVLLDKYGILKVKEEEYENLEKQYILASKKESYGYDCFTNERAFYAENYPNMIIEKGGIDQLILLMTGSEGGSFDEGIN